MNKLQILEIIEGYMIEPTRDKVSLEKCKAALAYSRAVGIENECKDIIIKSRKRWLEYLTITQRKWQRSTSNKNKARHHDSIGLREKYVRC